MAKIITAIATVFISVVIVLIIGVSFINYKPTPVNSCWFCGSQGTQNQEAMLTEKNQATLDKAQPPHTYNYSQERQNLIQRLDTLNKQGVVGYVYLLGANGQVIANYVTNGKVSSLNSYLTTTEQQINGGGAQCNADNTCSDTSPTNTVTSPDLDGSYGSNPQGIFFFTDKGALVEWSGPYLWSNSPMNITTAVTLTQQAK